jgi:hypothetical protein
MDIIRGIIHTAIITRIATIARIDTMATIDPIIGTAAIAITAITAIIITIGNEFDVSEGIPNRAGSRATSSQLIFQASSASNGQMKAGMVTSLAFQIPPVLSPGPLVGRSGTLFSAVE